MITEICLYLKNWFDWNMPKFYGKFKIENGELISYNDGDMGILNNQYFRIIGSVFNDGVYKLGEEELTDEVFTGAVWLMAVPKDFLSLVKDISEWQAKYGTVNSANMSPYQSESFGGYSYSKGGSGSASDSTVPTWKSVFRDRLWRYKKI
ncbi:MAG TPA: hypothetical protein DHV37_05755 [Erysipelotrichaceae bacterium]|nr:hypothetical protein [Erysipelotrichaceae bacterium]